VIRAQSLSSLNRPVRGRAPAGEPFKEFVHNGLCSQCNANQGLKVHQLSVFVPSKECNFDKEIELEK